MALSCGEIIGLPDCLGGALTPVLSALFRQHGVRGTLLLVHFEPSLDVDFVDFDSVAKQDALSVLSHVMSSMKILQRAEQSLTTDHDLHENAKNQGYTSDHDSKNAWPRFSWPKFRIWIAVQKRTRGLTHDHMYMN